MIGILYDSNNDNYAYCHFFILNNDGSVFVITLGPDGLEQKVVKVDDIPPVSYMVKDGEHVVLADVNSDGWKVISVVPGVVVEKVIVPSNEGMDKDILRRKGVDLSNVSEAYYREKGNSFVIHDDGKVSELRNVGLAGDGQYQQKWMGDYCGFSL